MNSRPRAIVVAGPSGGGKSSLFPVVGFGVDAFNVDDQAAEWNGGSYCAGPTDQSQLHAGSWTRVAQVPNRREPLSPRRPSSRIRGDVVTIGTIAMSSQGTTSDTALRFATHVIHGELDQARGMLAPSFGPDERSLEAEFRAMVELYDEHPESVAVVDVLDDWPGRQEEDVGWAYVSISGSDWSEGVAVVVSVQDEGRPQVREVVWGRP